ncbi:hypothetical protein T07_10270 [Trichinella nelsoni]|uniref:Uncharacterized protein n=1 Tax=Trichinella nelsoni TaxID=6336 RepID=A0A0V0RT54_9BILA|nr:hypothetical protein T07_10270 [Trichinella nelsoni]
MTAFSGSMIDGGGSSEMLFVGFPFLERCCIVQSANAAINRIDTSALSEERKKIDPRSSLRRVLAEKRPVRSCSFLPRPRACDVPLTHVQFSSL